MVPMKTPWGATDIPNLKGRTAIVTGASSGTGYEIALQLAKHGAHVVLASRDAARTREAAQRIKSAVPEASTEAQRLDLAELASIRGFVEQFFKSHDRLDILVNNAGVVGGPRRQTVDRMEMHFQVNHVGHFALTGLLLPALRAQSGSRVVTLSSGVAAQGKIAFDDLQGEHRYRMITAYSQAKLANLLFALELQRRSQLARAGIVSLAAHPGIVKTNLLVGREADWGRSRQGVEHIVRFAQILLGRPPAAGALAPLYQATDPGALSANYVGIAEVGSAYPRLCKVPPAALDKVTASRLWDVSAELSGVRYEGM
jgi:NAD(P)-dependent dehydrogenase (short-subunit alcohol dehydrogenase family)